jgi:tRNA A-37 threonylcarbamoyl transferase component Bud32
MNEASIINIGLQLINRIESLHGLGYCHGNICPSSIYFGGKQKTQIILADFYHSEKYRCSLSAEKSMALYEFERVLKEKMECKSFPKDLVFASWNSLNQPENSFRKDDVSSLIFVLVYLFKGY